MSDDDNQEPVAATDETIEFSSDPFADETDTPVEEAKPDTAEPADADTPEPPAETEEPAEDGDVKPEEPTDEAQPEEEKSEADLKQMTRAERKEYFEAQKQEQQRSVDQVIDATYQPQPVNELQQYYMEQGHTEGEALILARQDVADQKAQIAEAKSEIVELNANLRVDSLEAQQKFDWMNPEKTDSYDKDLHNLTAQIYGQMITTDPRTGQIIDARMTPMQLASIIDKARNSGSAKAALKAQKAAEQQMAAAAPPTSSAPSKAQTAEDKQAEALERALNSAM
jgi:hypothetical protein